MKKILFVLLIVLFVPSFTSAQSAVPGSVLVFDQPNASPATAQSYVYRYFPDGNPVGTVLTGVTCADVGGTTTCQVPFPAFTPGQHTIEISAENAAGESNNSAPLTFTFVVVPSPPTNLRIQ